MARDPVRAGGRDRGTGTFAASELTAVLATGLAHPRQCGCAWRCCRTPSRLAEPVPGHLSLTDRIRVRPPHRGHRIQDVARGHRLNRLTSRALGPECASNNGLVSGRRHSPLALAGDSQPSSPTDVDPSHAPRSPPLTTDPTRLCLRRLEWSCRTVERPIDHVANRGADARFPEGSPAAVRVQRIRSHPCLGDRVCPAEASGLESPLITASTTMALNVGSRIATT